MNSTSLLGCPFDDLFHTATAAAGWSSCLAGRSSWLGRGEFAFGRRAPNWVWSVGDYRRDKPMTKPQRAEGRAGNWRAPLL